jgi:hypothetical protein
MPNRVARLLAVLAVQPRYLPSKIPFVRRRDFSATNIRRGEERASAEASALEVSGKLVWLQLDEFTAEFLRLPPLLIV